MTLLPTPVSAAAIKEATGFFERFGGISGFLESILNVPGGYLQHWHQRNVIRWYDEFLAENDKRSAEGRRAIPPSLLMPALQRIAMEDDDDMLVRWARLFANFQDAKRRFEPNKVFVHVLSEMQPLDARLLEYTVDTLSLEQAVAAPLLARL